MNSSPVSACRRRLSFQIVVDFRSVFQGSFEALAGRVNFFYRHNSPGCPHCARILGHGAEIVVCSSVFAHMFVFLKRSPDGEGCNLVAFQFKNRWPESL